MRRGRGRGRACLLVLAGSEEDGVAWRRQFMQTLLERDLPQWRVRVPAEALRRFWATHQGAEIDLILRRGERLLGVECKRADAPRLTRSIRIAMEDLGLERVAVIYPGTRRYVLDERVEVVPLAALADRGSLFGQDWRGGEDRIAGFHRITCRVRRICSSHPSAIMC